MNFSLINEFETAYQSDPQGTEIENWVIDLGKVSSIDSSGLGMLLQMHNHVEEQEADEKLIKIINCPHEISSVLKVANFHKLFDIQ